LKIIDLQIVVYGSTQGSISPAYVYSKSDLVTKQTAHCEAAQPSLCQMTGNTYADRLIQE